MNIKQNCDAFSLLEMLLVVLVLAVVATLSAPMFAKSFELMQLKKTAEDLTYRMRYAQSRAIMKEKTVRLEFSPDFRRYWITENNQQQQEQNKQESFERILNSMRRDIELPNHVIVQGASNQIDFSSDGQVEPTVIYVCSQLKENIEQKCYTITTKIKRASIDLLNEKWNDSNENEQDFTK